MSNYLYYFFKVLYYFYIFSLSGLDIFLYNSLKTGSDMRNSVVAEVMKKKGFTYDQLAEVSGVSRGQLFRITEDPIKNNCTPQTLLKVCKALNIKIEQVYINSLDEVITLAEHEKALELKDLEIRKLKDEKIELMEKLLK